MMLSVCLPVAYIEPKSRTERPGKTKIGTEVAHVTRDSDTIFKVKRLKVKVAGGRGHIVAASLTACLFLRRLLLPLLLPLPGRVMQQINIVNASSESVERCY